MAHIKEWAAENFMRGVLIDACVVFLFIIFLNKSIHYANSIASIFRGESKKHHIKKTCIFKYVENFTSKNWKFSDKKLMFFIFVLKI